MNESGVFDATGSFSMGSSRLAGDRLYVINEAALGLLLTGLCVGILYLLDFMIAVCRKKIHTQHLTVFMVSFTFTSVLQMLSTSVVAMRFLGIYCYLKHCDYLLVVWLASRQLGVLLHLLVGLEFLLIRSKSRFGSRLLRTHWTLPVVLTLSLISLLFTGVLQASVFLGAVAITLTCLVSILACLFFKSMKKYCIIVACLAFATLGTYCPSFVFECMAISGLSVSVYVYEIFMCLTNMRLLMGGFLCWVIFRTTPEVAPQRLEAGQVNLDPLSQVPV
ncbi:uncharacterized protein LOC117807775 [Notolabrus celidotus]|uniref:uncharacterized protein LOC117807775 n=1 Tax=Notolabrus celidotus TaxID=1203425 RepID=UPI00148FD036|nr:uncharacterized protein LOC117807775 [Notolabrus celidotus]